MRDDACENTTNVILFSRSLFGFGVLKVVVDLFDQSLEMVEWRILAVGRFASWQRTVQVKRRNMGSSETWQLKLTVLGGERVVSSASSLKFITNAIRLLTNFF